MSQVSKRKLSKQLEDETYKAFWLTIAKFTKKEEINLFFSDLFTKTERINFTKRLAIAILLYKECEWLIISDLLKVSLGSIAKMASKINSAGFKIYFKKVERDAIWKSFWEDFFKTYIAITHPEKYARLGKEGVEKLYIKKHQSRLLS